MNDTGVEPKDSIEDLKYQVRQSQLKQKKLQIALQEYLLYRSVLDNENLKRKCKANFETVSRLVQQKLGLEQKLKETKSTGKLNKTDQIAIKRLKLLCQSQREALDQVNQQIQQNKDEIEELKAQFKDQASDDSFETSFFVGTTNGLRMSLKDELDALKAEPEEEEMEKRYLKHLQKIERNLMVLNQGLNTGDTQSKSLEGSSRRSNVFQSHLKRLFQTRNNKQSVFAMTTHITS